MHPAPKMTPNVLYQHAGPVQEDCRDELLDGLTRPQKTVDPKWFYDETGSELFEHITQLPEYYPTRTEVSILKDNAAAIATCCGDNVVLIEPGAGNCEKAELLIETMRPTAYVPLDISAEFLRGAAARLGRTYPWLTVNAVCTDFNQDWSFLANLPAGRRVVFYPGSTIGNLEPGAAAAFLRRVRQLVGEDGGLLLGVDLHKPAKILHAAYNDASGTTARFNLNLLSRLNRELDAGFDAQLFEHLAFYNEEHRRIEMHLVSPQAQSVRCNGSQIEFEQGETIHTENSYKYTQESFSALAESAGFSIRHSWLDEQRLFSVHYLDASKGR